MSQPEDYSWLWIVLVILLAYGLPSFIAFYRVHPNRWLIMLVNVFLGGTGLGWFGSLIWAMSAVHRSPTGNHGGESGLNVFVNDKPALLAAATPLEPDPGEQLTRLKALLDNGTITEIEYQMSRRRWIERLAQL